MTADERIAILEQALFEISRDNWNLPSWAKWRADIALADARDPNKATPPKREDTR